MRFSIDGEDLPPKTSFAHAVYQHLYPALSDDCLGLDVDRDIFEPLRKANPHWASPGKDTVIEFPRSDGSTTTFRVWHPKRPR